MMTIEEIREQLADRNITKVAEKTGLSRAAIYKVLQPNSRPYYDTVVKLAAYLRETALRGD